MIACQTLKLKVMAIDRIENDAEKVTKHYYLLSQTFDVQTFIKITRECWNIEYGLHWRNDTLYK